MPQNGGWKPPLPQKRLPSAAHLLLRGVSFDYSTATLQEVYEHVTAGGIVDQGRLNSLQKCLDSDWQITQQEAELLFQINDATSQNQGHTPEWQEFFIDAITKHDVFDMTSPGEIDEPEGNWLAALIAKDGRCDSNELQLLI